MDQAKRRRISAKGWLTQTANQIAAYVGERRDGIVLLETTLNDLLQSEFEMEPEKEEDVEQSSKQRHRWHFGDTNRGVTIHPLAGTAN
jgi:hypothetical protein